MERLSKEKEFKAYFVWSGKQCALIAFDDGALSAWDKPLEKLLEQYPRWNSLNIVIVDHKACRMDSNPSTNMIISTSFYMEKVERLRDDISFLKSSLWLLLQGLFDSIDVADFHSQFLQSVQGLNAKVPKLYEKEETFGIVEDLQGKGSYRPLGPG
jgi:hypothetical protein